MQDGFKAAGLVEGRDIETVVRNAQGDMATVSALVDAAVGDGADLLLTFSTPTLQAAIQRAGKIPIVFTYVASPIAAGAGKTDTDHLPNVTGVYLQASYDEMIQVIRSVVPSVKSVGTLFVPSESNSVFSRDQLAAAVKKAGLAFIDVPANTSSDVPDASLALAARRPDVICQIPGNLTASAYPTLQQAADRARLPIFAFQSAQADGGAVVVLGRDYHEAGMQSATLAVRVMRGERPGRHSVRERRQDAAGRESRLRAPDRPDAASQPRRARRSRGGRPLMEITRRTTGDWTDLVVEGRLDGYWAEHLDAGIAEAIREGGLRLRLDLEKVTFLSSAGIGVLVKFHKRLAAVKGSLVIARLSAPVKTVLEMTRLTALARRDRRGRRRGHAHRRVHAVASRPALRGLRSRILRHAWR